MLHASNQNIIPVDLMRQEEFLLYDMGSERAFLACIVRQPDLIRRAEHVVPPEHLFFEINKYIYRAMLYIYHLCAQNQWAFRFDSMSMLSVVQRMGRDYEQRFLAHTDGMEQVRGIEMLNVSPLQFDQYVSIVNDRAMRVLAYRQSRHVQVRALDMAANPDAGQLVIGAESEFGQMAYAGRVNNQNHIRLLGSDRQEFDIRADLMHSYPHSHLFNVPCSLFPFWMSMMHGGLVRKGLTMIAARPKIGKSTLASQLALFTSVEQALPVLYLDTEMSSREHYSRVISALSGVDEDTLIRGKHWDDRNLWDRTTAAQDRLDAAPFHYLNIAGKPMPYITSVIRQFVSHNVPMLSLRVPSTGQEYRYRAPCLIIYDWLKLSDASSLQHAQEFQLLGFQASSLKDVAGELDVPILALAQNNRAAVGVTGEDWREMAEAYVAGSDRLAQFCTMLCILRNVTRDEAEVVSTLPVPPCRPRACPDLGILQRTTDTSSNSWRFNQFLHVVLHRGGDEYRDGIPLYLRRGLATYEEVSDSETLRIAKELGRSKKVPEKTSASRAQRLAATPVSPPATTPALPAPAAPQVVDIVGHPSPEAPI